MLTESPEVLDRQILAEIAQNLVKCVSQVPLGLFEQSSEVTDGVYRLVTDFEGEERNSVDHLTVEYHATHARLGGPFYVFRIGTVYSPNDISLSIRVPQNVEQIDDAATGFVCRIGEEWMRVEMTEDKTNNKAVPFDDLPESHRRQLAAGLRDMERLCNELPAGSPSDEVHGQQRIQRKKYRDFLRLTHPES